MDRNPDEIREFLQAGAECLDQQQIASVFHGDGDPAALARARKHVESCTRCTAEVELYRTFMYGETSTEDSADVRWIVHQLEARKPAPTVVRSFEPRRPGFLATWLAGWRLPAFSLAAAGLLMAVGLLVSYRSNPVIDLTGTTPGVEVRSGEIEIVSPAGDAEQVPGRLEWKTGANAARYRVRLMEVDRNEIWTSEIDGTSIPIPEEVRSRIVPGKRLLWQVVALGTDGNPVSSSADTSFRVKPRAAR